MHSSLVMVLSYFSNVRDSLCPRRAPASTKSETSAQRDITKAPWQSRKRSIRSPSVTPPRTPQTDEVTTIPGGMMAPKTANEIAFVPTFCTLPAEPKAPWASKASWAPKGYNAQCLARCVDGSYTSEWRNLLSFEDAASTKSTRCRKVSSSSMTTNDDATQYLEALAAERDGHNTPPKSIRPPPGLSTPPRAPTPPIRSPRDDADKLRVAAHEAVFRLKDLQADGSKRFVVGFREVSRMINAGQAKVVVAPQLDATDDGVVTQRVMEMEGMCAAAGIPLVKGLSRATLGEAIGKNIAVSVLAILDTTGAEEEVAKMLRVA